MSFTTRFKKINYFQHDSRFSKTFPRNSRPSRGFDIHKLHKYVQDGYDVNMDSGPKPLSNRRYTHPYFNSRRIRGTYVRGGGLGRSVLGSPSYWFKVTVYHGKSYDRQDIIRKLQNYVKPVLFIPFGFRLENDNLIFFVDNKKASEAINESNLKLKMNDGCLLQMKVESTTPIVDINVALKEKIIRVMSSKYDAATQHLDLSKFYANDVFLNDDLIVSLSKPNVASGVFQIINENIPNLRSLNLSFNKISTTQHFSLLKNHANEIKSINLSRNWIKSLNDLYCLEGLKLDTLMLDLNPLCSYFQDQNKYVREVRKIFPTLLFLDGVALSSPSLDRQENNSNASLPTTPAPLKLFFKSQRKVTTNPNGGPFTQQFLELFYSMYDNPSGDRSALNEAYALTGEFSLITSNFSGVKSNKYVTENHNSIRINNHLEGKTEILLIGKQNIVKFLSTLPKTQHDLSSFKLELMVFTTELVSLRITGVFREVEYTPSPIKAFSREFTLISNGSGYSIVKDALSVTEATSEQATTAFGSQSTSNKQVADVSNLLKSSLCLNTDTSPAAAFPPLPSTSGISQERQNIVAALSKHSGMNLLWSKKCLDETNWELQKAIEAFTEFHKRNAIPAEAFV